MSSAFLLLRDLGVLTAVALWAGSAVWAAADARRRCRVRSQVRLAATLAAALPLAGALLYLCVRPAEPIVEARRRRLARRLYEETGSRALPAHPLAAPEAIRPEPAPLRLTA